jgi:hypothetical protein
MSGSVIARPAGVEPLDCDFRSADAFGVLLLTNRYVPAHARAARTENALIAGLDLPIAVLVVILWTIVANTYNSSLDGLLQQGAIGTPAHRRHERRTRNVGNRADKGQSTCKLP